MKINLSKHNGKILVQKSYATIAEENAALAKRLDYITKEELIKAIKLIASELELEVGFTYDNLKKTL